MPIDVVQWRVRIGLFHSEGAYREMRRRCGRKHQKIKIKSLVGDVSFVVAVVLLAIELIRAMMLHSITVLSRLQWRDVTEFFHTTLSSLHSQWQQQDDKPSVSRKSTRRSMPNLITDLPSLTAVCVVVLHSVVRMLLLLSGDVEQNPGPQVILSVGDLPTLTNILGGAAPMWMTIGDQLGFIDGELGSIQSIPQCITGGDQVCFRKLLAQWLRWAPPKHELPTLGKLASAVREAGEERLAYDLAQKYQEKKGVELMMDVPLLQDQRPNASDELMMDTPPAKPPKLDQLHKSVLLAPSNANEIGAILKQAEFLPSDWESLASQLRIADRERIKQKYQDPTLCMEEAIRQWLHNEMPNVSWEKLSTAVSKVDRYGEGTKRTILRLAERAAKDNLPQSPTVSTDGESPHGASATGNERSRSPDDVTDDERTSPHTDSSRLSYGQTRDETASEHSVSTLNPERDTDVKDQSGAGDEGQRLMISVTECKAWIINLRMKLQNLVGRTLKVMKDKKVDISEARLAITDIPMSLRDESRKSLQEIIPKIAQATSLDELVLHLNCSYCWNYLNFDLLRNVIDFYGDDETKQMMKEYKSEVTDFRKKTSVCVFWEANDCESTIRPEDIPPNVKEYTVKCDWSPDSKTLEDIEELRKKIACELYLCNFAVCFCIARPNTVEIVFLVPSFAPEDHVTAQTGGTQETMEKVKQLELAPKPLSPQEQLPVLGSSTAVKGTGHPDDTDVHKLGDSEEKVEGVPEALPTRGFKEDVMTAAQLLAILKIERKEKEELQQQLVQSEQQHEGQRHPSSPMFTVIECKDCIKKLERKLEKLLSTTHEIMKKNGVAVSSLCITIANAPISVRDKSTMFLNKFIPEIARATSLFEVFLYLGRYCWDYLDFDLLQHIVERYGDDKTRQMMREYDSEVKDFRKKTSVHVFWEANDRQPIIHPEEIPPNVKEYVVKHDWSSDSKTLEDVEKLREETACELGLYKLAIYVYRVLPSPFALVSHANTAPATSLDTKAAYQDRIKFLEKETQEKATEIQQLTQDVRNLESQQAKLQKELSTTQKELSEVEGEHSVQKTASESLQEQLVESELRARMAEQESQQAREELQKANQQLQTVQRERDEFAAVVELKDKQMDWEKKELDEYKRAHSQLRSAVSRQESELDHLRDEYAQLLDHHSTHKHDPTYPGVCFYGDPLQESVDSSGRLIQWPQVGITLDIPPGAVPSGEVLYLSIWPCLSGPYVLPPGWELLSPAYLIKPAFHFRKPVKLSLAHFARLSTDEDCDKMAFVSAQFSSEITEKKPEYHFRVLDKGLFRKGESVGTTCITHFCAPAVAGEQKQRIEQAESPSTWQREYSLLLYHIKSIPYKCDGYAVFAVSFCHPLYLKNLKKDIKKQFCGIKFWRSQKHRVQMIADAVEVEYPSAVGTWRIEPDMKPPSISQKDVDLPNYYPEVSCSKEYYPPRILLTITSPQEGAEDDKCSLRVVGVSEHVEFLMQLKREKQPESSETLPRSLPHSSTTLGKRPTLRMLLAFPAREGMLNIPDMIGTRCTQLGIFLLEDDTGAKVRAFRTQYHDDAQTINIEILTEWIHGRGKQPVTWRTLVEVLRIVGLNSLADSIAVVKY